MAANVEQPRDAAPRPERRRKARASASATESTAISALPPGQSTELESAAPLRPAEPPSRDEIARRAYEIYLERGGEAGHDQDDWFRAERELGSVDR
jgi:hypothetical protein